MTVASMACTACALSPPKDKKHCHECHGSGFTDLPAKCTQQLPECPIGYEHMVDGWYCSKCHRSGPLG